MSGVGACEGRRQKAVGSEDRGGGMVQILWVLVAHDKHLAFTLTETGGLGRFLQKRAAQLDLHFKRISPEG